MPDPSPNASSHTAEPSLPPPALFSEERKAEFHFKEFEALRREVEATVVDARSMERYAVVGCGAVWAWLVQQSANPSVGQAIWAWWIPVLFSALGTVRSWAIGKHLSLISAYTLTIEARYAGDQSPPTGWQHFSKKYAYIGSTALIFWWLLNLGTVSVAVLQTPSLSKHLLPHAAAQASSTGQAQPAAKR